MDPRDPVALNLAHRLLDRLPADTIDELMANVGPGSHRGQTVTTSGPARAEPAAGERLGDVKSLYDPLDVFKGNDRVPPANRQL